LSCVTQKPPRPNPRTCPCHIDGAAVSSHEPSCSFYDPGLVLCPACQGCGSFFGGRSVCEHCKGTGESQRPSPPHGCMLVGLQGQPW
jgi:hypothetical protein